MANFPPLKKHILNLIDELIESHKLTTGTFLDVGCGIGDISLHLAKRGWRGRAIDFSAAAIVKARVSLAPYPVTAAVDDLFNVKGKFDLIVMATVIEHIKNDTVALQYLRSLLPAEPDAAHLIISMPINPQKEWRWDDDFYGHYRRYNPTYLKQQLKECGFEVIEFWDYTYPVF